MSLSKESTNWPQMVISPHLLEMARILSLERDSEPVLCADLLPSVDVLLSADPSRQFSAVPQLLQARFKELCKAIPRPEGGISQVEPWSRATLSFGLVRWWPARVRDRALAVWGPPASIYCDVNFADIADAHCVSM